MGSSRPIGCGSITARERKHSHAQRRNGPRCPRAPLFPRADDPLLIATYASPDPGGRRTTPGMPEPYWHPLYAKCQEWGIPIIVHGTNALDRRFRVVPHNYQLGFYTEQYLATQFLGHGDVFERFPELRIVVCHCGGGLDRFHKTDPHLSQKDLSKNLFFDTCAYESLFLECAIKQRGVDRIVFGTEDDAVTPRCLM